MNESQTNCPGSLFLKQLMHKIYNLVMHKFLQSTSAPILQSTSAPKRRIFQITKPPMKNVSTYANVRSIFLFLLFFQDFFVYCKKYAIL